MFERLGEKVERFKQEAVAARDESADYRCRNCDTEIYSEQEKCPECGSTELDRVADVEADTADTTEETAAVEEAGTADGTAETEDDVGREAAEEAEKIDE